MMKKSACSTLTKSKSLIVYLPMLLLVVSLAWPPHGSRASRHDSQKSQSKAIFDRRVTVILRNTSVKNALHALSNRAKLPVGFVGIAGENGKPKTIDVNAVQRTITEILDSIVQSDDRYKWEVVNGVINVSPISGLGVISDLKIDFLQLSKIKMLDIGSAILDAPEICSKLESMGKSKTVELNYSGRPLTNAAISATFSNTTIRAALNELLSKGQARFWAVEMLGEKDEFVRIILFD